MGINGEKSLLNRHHLPHLHLLHHHHHHHHHGKKQQARDVPKGCLAIKVGVQDEEQQRFVVPVMYFNHPLFMQLLKEAEEEYGFDQKGAITLPCHVEEFRYVQSLIDREQQHHHHHHHHHVGCLFVFLVNFWCMKRVMRGVPKGCLGIRVGVEGEEQQCFVVPVTYVNHPLFMH
ncbi:hypothetical protein RJ639_009877 [Escallonia herrerae]|uniref:Uncharacterized protein n=1 Tax=Escallonia herrerae TaxID=1293975 RepID=A0AA88VVS8_9ASTE|nr:hypothetical protein RJ639_009877 [Escallonia herrerae]